MQRIFFALFLWWFLLATASARIMPAEKREGEAPAEPTQQKEKPTIAVTTFENLSAYPENAWVAMSFSEALTVKLKRLYERFILVERLRVYEVIKAQGFDPEKVDSLEVTRQREVGSLIGANYLILGSVSLQGLADEPQTKLLANMRTVDVRTGEIKEATSVKGQMQEIFDLQIQLAFAFLKQVGVDITVAEEQQLSIKETESLLAEKYYNLGNQHFYEGNLEAAEAWYARAVELLEGGYYREAALRRVEVLRQQKAAAKTEAEKQQVLDKMRKRIDQIHQRRAEADEMLFEQAELLTEVGQYEQAIEAYQLYLERVKPWRQIQWRSDVNVRGLNIVVGEKLIYTHIAITPERHSLYILSALDREGGQLKWKLEIPDKPPTFDSDVMSVGDLVYFRAGDTLYALSQETGQEKWKFEAPRGKSPHQDEPSQPLIIDIRNKEQAPMMQVTSLGRQNLPSLKEFQSFRPFPVDRLSGDWEVEASFADDGRNNADPVVIRNRTDNGRVAIFYQAADEGEMAFGKDQPRAKVISEFILNWLKTVVDPSKVDIAMYTDQTCWITKDAANRVAKEIKAAVGHQVKSVDFVSEADLPDWIQTNMRDDAMDIILLFGDFPHSIYPSGNAQPDGSLAELFLEDGNMFLNTADYIFWGGEGARNGPGGLQNMLDATGPAVLHNPSAFTEAEHWIYLRGSNGVLYALARETGELKWQLNTVENLPGGAITLLEPLISGGIIYLNRYDALVGRGQSYHNRYDALVGHCISALKAETGSVIWTTQIPINNVGSSFKNHLILRFAQDRSGTVYVPTIRGVYALGAETGQLKWQSEPYAVYAMVGFDRNLLYVFTHDQDFYALNAETGKLQWKRRIKEGLAFRSNQSWNPFVVTNGVLLHQTAEHLYALEAETGEILWKFEVQGFPFPPIIQNHTVYFSPNDDHLYALALDTGKIQWEFTPIEGGIWDYAVASEGTVYINAKGFFALNPRPTEYASQPEEADALVGIGRAKGLWGRYEDAVESLQKALESRAYSTNKAYQELALCYERMGNWSEATRTWHRYLAASLKGGGRGVPREAAHHLWELAGVRWHGPGMGEYNGIGIMAVTADAVYLTASDGYVVALDQQTGQLLWKFRGRSLAQSEDQVYVLPQFGSPDAVYALDRRTGAVVWKHPWQEPDTPEYLVVSGEVVYVSSYTWTSRNLSALSAQTGELLWKSDSYRQEGNWSSKPIVSDKIYWSPDVRYVYALSKENGALKWRFDRGELVDEMERIAGPGTFAPVVAERLVYMTMPDALCAIDKETGEVVWKTPIPGIRRYSRFTDEIRWQRVEVPTEYISEFLADFADGEQGESPYVTNVYTSGSEGKEIAVNRETGELRWRFRVGDTILQLTVANGTLYAATEHVLYAFDLEKIEQLLAKGRRWWEAE